MATRTVEDGGTYPSLNSALAASDPSDTIEISGTWAGDDTTQCTVSDDNLTITVLTDGAEHPGKYDQAGTSHHALRYAGSGHAITMSGYNKAITITGLCVVLNNTTTSAECFRCETKTGGTTTLKNCVLICETNTTQQDCVYTGHNTAFGTVTLENCMLSGAGRAGIHSQNNYSTSAGNNGTINVNSCTICKNGQVNGTTAGNFGGGVYVSTDLAGYAQDQDVNVHNSTIMGNDDNSGADMQFSGGLASIAYPNGGTGTWSVSNTVVSDGSFGTANEPVNAGSNQLGNYNLITTDTAGDSIIVETIATDETADWRLKDLANNDAIDQHATDTAHGLTIPNTDIVGTTRKANGSHDLGAFEIGAAVTVSDVPRLQNQRFSHLLRR